MEAVGALSTTGEGGSGAFAHTARGPLLAHSESGNHLRSIRDEPSCLYSECAMSWKRYVRFAPWGAAQITLMNASRVGVGSPHTDVMTAPRLTNPHYKKTIRLLQQNWNNWEMASTLPLAYCYAMAYFIMLAKLKKFKTDGPSTSTTTE